MRSLIESILDTDKDVKTYSHNIEIHKLIDALIECLPTLNVSYLDEFKTVVITYQYDRTAKSIGNFIYLANTLQTVFGKDNVIVNRSMLQIHLTFKHNGHEVRFSLVNHDDVSYKVSYKAFNINIVTDDNQTYRDIKKICEQKLPF